MLTAAVLVASGAGPVSAGAAEDWAAPVLTPPAPDTLLTGTAELTATSESPYVVFELATSASSTWIVRRTPVAAGPDGNFRDTLPTAGLPPRFVAWVRACSDASLESCTTVSEPVPVRGPRPTLTPTKPLPSVIDPSVTKQVSLRVTGLGGSPATVDGDVTSRQVHDGDVIDVAISSTSSVDLFVSLRQCNSLNGQVCERTGLSLTVRKEPDLTLWGPSTMLLSQNGDGLWETATSQVSLDSRTPLTARWRIISAAGATVAGPYEFSADQIREARNPAPWGTRILIDPKERLGRPLPAGEYRFEVETTATAPDFKKSTRKSETLFISNAAPMTRLTPKTSVFYPQAVAATGVPRVMELSPRIDSYEARLTGFRFRVLTADGKPLGDPIGGIGWDQPVIAWDGAIRREGRPATTAPEGTYRIELIRTIRTGAGVDESDVYGPVSAPFTLRRGYPDSVTRSVAASARSSWQRTAVKQNARVQRGKHGVLRFRRKAAGKGAARVTSVHSVRIPRDRLKDRRMRIRLHGAWGNPGDVKIAVIAPWGETLQRRALTRNRRHLEVAVPERWVRADGRLRFAVQWKGTKPARLDRVVVRYRRYDLTS
ncbi:hypothetical protein [Mumia sp. ZJ430]|uniref:hypothetical protein n=1 Tax=Mumia sp. ZJ430 TaxID=2708083 RepID=UPI001420ECA5|nr:hypothetical protein [Mumia sp. ZJ430]